ncbi:type II toxin-antitoxin system PrlF family antitoxin [Thalassospira sp.]|uniref:AbrB/MazE/SpoVT family DNA-binding domain-containing protein n=1 Tax=Thalassospira sp. TaxID=1912094 RepID=UPI0027350BDE|nr:type II toxin-antitoxin system PrlF family antitoxin [Thalassospira sp.]MDP2699585.1 type II toxin-antitoxin system PrlF family antitoxin [Thalassospira sp.]
MITSRLTTKSQTVIPRSVRDFLHVGPGDEIIYEIRGDAVLLKRKPSEPATDDPFHLFDEWKSPADEDAYADL